MIRNVASDNYSIITTDIAYMLIVQILGSVMENAKEELTFLNKMGDKLVRETDHQLVNTVPIQDQLATLNGTYKDVLDCLEQVEAELEMVITFVFAFCVLENGQYY